MDAYWSGRMASSSKENFPWIPWHNSGGTSTGCEKMYYWLPMEDHVHLHS
jgi:hypothetical protein